MHKTPRHCSYEELERKYWNSVRQGCPIYGADVTNAITDPDVEEWNMAKLDSILQYVQEDSGNLFLVRWGIGQYVEVICLS